MTPFDWEEFLEFAEEQVRGRGNPAADRSAISRAYYAVFHEAKNYYVQRGGRLTYLGDDHGIVARWFRESKVRDQRRIGFWIQELREKRRDADYEDRFVDLSREAQARVVRAREALDAINRLR